MNGDVEYGFISKCVEDVIMIVLILLEYTVIVNERTSTVVKEFTKWCLAILAQTIPTVKLTSTPGT